MRRDALLTAALTPKINNRRIMVANLVRGVLLFGHGLCSGPRLTLGK